VSLGCAKIAALVAGAGCVAAAAAGQEIVQPVRGLRVPFEFYEDGSIKAQLEAGLAMVGANGDVEATDVRVEFRKQDGAAEGGVRAEDCRYLRGAGRLTSESPVRMERDGLDIAGRGLEWSISNKVVVIKSNVRVVLNRSPGLMASALARRPGSAAVGRKGGTTREAGR